MNAYEKVKKYGQEHLLAFENELSDEQKAALHAQIESLDFDVLSNIEHMSKPVARGKFSKLETVTIDKIEAKKDEYKAVGVDAIKNGKVGAVLLAGGMGTRLGSNDPKGMYNVGITKDLYIFQCLVNNLMDVVKETGAYVHLFVMTSDLNHEATVNFFKKMNNFGYPSEYVTFFQQEMAPCVSREGKVFLERKDKVSVSPNGNGGWFLSMIKSGVLDKVKANGIEWLNIFAVDNVLQRIADPVFVGATIAEGKSSGAKVIRKATPDEKVGAICLEDGHPSIVEYYELTDEMRDELDENGERVYNFGVILNYLFGVKELEEMVKGALPYHVVEKKIPYLDDNGVEVKPEEPNGCKFETLVLDMVHQAESCLSFEIVREKEFAPIKNKTGIDSVESARELLKLNGVEL